MQSLSKRLFCKHLFLTLVESIFFTLTGRVGIVFRTFRKLTILKITIKQQLSSGTATNNLVSNIGSVINYPILFSLVS